MSSLTEYNCIPRMRFFVGAAKEAAGMKLAAAAARALFFRKVLRDWFI
jgi:hypothetical protein